MFEYLFSDLVGVEVIFSISIMNCTRQLFMSGFVRCQTHCCMEKIIKFLRQYMIMFLHNKSEKSKCLLFFKTAKLHVQTWYKKAEQFKNQQNSIFDIILVIFIYFTHCFKQAICNAIQQTVIGLCPDSTRLSSRVWRKFSNEYCKLTYFGNRFIFSIFVSRKIKQK